MGVLKRLLLVSIVLAFGLLASALPAGGGAAAEKPALRLAKRAPLTIVGLRFQAGERVTIIVNGTSGERALRTATPEGSFTARFEKLALGRCDGLFVRASGSRGSRAVLKRPAPMCLPQ